jgi:hypothetical protein
MKRSDLPSGYSGLDRLLRASIDNAQASLLHLDLLAVSMPAIDPARVHIERLRALMLKDGATLRQTRTLLRATFEAPGTTS